MPTDLNDLKIDRADRHPTRGSKRGLLLAAAAVLVAAVLGAAFLLRADSPEVQTARVTTSAATAGPAVILNATGYIVAAHKIEVGSKVMGKVAWIGVDKGDRVRQGQVLVRLENEEYRAQLDQAHGQLAALQAKLSELEAGSRPEEIAQAKADVAQARADLVNSRVTLKRTRELVQQGVLSRQALDDAQARFDGQVARVASLEKRSELVDLGPRHEEIAQARGQVQQARGAMDFAQTQLDNTVIKAPVTGTILERAVEKGEFVTTSFVGDRGAKGYVVTLADLNDLEVELDISQNDFGKLGPAQRGWVTTDAYPDRRYDGYIRQISPEANRQKATVQVKVKIVNPDEYLRPDMNATVAFYSPEKVVPGKPAVTVPPAALRDGAVFVVLDGKAVRRPAKSLIGGEDVIVNPPPSLKDGESVRPRKG